MPRPLLASLRERLLAHRERVAIILGWALVPLPVAGWIIAQSFPGRIDEVWEWLSAYMHSLATSTFAVLFLASALVNVLVLIRRAPRRSSRATARYALSQSVVIALALAWIACLGVGSAAQYVEMLVGTLIAGASIATLAVASTTASESADSPDPSQAVRPDAAEQ